MLIRVSRPLVTWLLVALSIVACGGGGASPGSVFREGGPEGSVTVLGDATVGDVSPPEIDIGDGAPPMVQGDGGCSSGACDAVTDYCGDGIITPPEACDDGNDRPGDGCSGSCQVEPGWACPAAGQACVKIWVCGNSHVDPGEECDDGNTTPGDGCSAVCTVEPGYACPNNYGPASCLSTTGRPCCDTISAAAAAAGCVGAACLKLAVDVCGDSKLSGTEQCDDGNMLSGDGCSSTCQLEPGWTCKTPGQPCTRIEYCGNGILELDIGEECDDGNKVSGDGCSATCQVEPGFVCPTPGQACVSTVVCGDGLLGGSEQCDSGRFNGSGGCTATCTLVPGWVCPTAGAPCVTRCGDGIVAGVELCDLGALNGTGQGCSANCTVDTGFGCVVSSSGGADGGADGGGVQSVCSKTVCGNGVVEGAEQCDDGNLIPYDGCSPTCTIEPKCNGQGQCTSVCGDGLVEPSEECDLGALNGRAQGCSATCQLEPADGWSCANAPQPPPPTLAIPILYRDMLYHNPPAGIGRATTVLPNPAPAGGGHPDFNCGQGLCSANGAVSTGEVNAILGADGKPIFASVGNPPTLTNAVNFCWWFHDTGCVDGGANPFAKVVFLDLGGNPTTLTLTQGTSGTYTSTNQQFFPIDGLGWNAGTNPETDVDCEPGLPHAARNFSFTSELHYIFTYQASIAASTTPAVFNFTGDDDVWGFINNHLVVDLGGVHNPANGSFTLNTANAASIGLVDGGWYSIDLFQAEANTCRSTYALTLSNFAHLVTQCATVCGDGIVAGTEQCDPGTVSSDGGVSDASASDATVGDGGVSGVYGGCNANCTLGPYCGDGILQTPQEQCDDGRNVVLYGGATKQCGPGCKFAPYCGDGVVSNSEQCDKGMNNVALSTNPYGANICTTACTIAPYCGDGTVQAANGEQCDDGPNNGSSGSNCDSTCKFKCGNGTVDPGEQCDNGAKNVDPATMPYGAGICTTACRLAPYCGDSLLQTPPEQCDYGTAGNTGSYGGCNADCTIGPYCGDGVVQSPPETCDNGVNNVIPATAYGAGVCTITCAPAPYCGDGVVQTQFGEQCDSTPGCTSVCKTSGAQ